MPKPILCPPGQGMVATLAPLQATPIQPALRGSEKGENAPPVPDMAPGPPGPTAGRRWGRPRAYWGNPRLRAGGRADGARTRREQWKPCPWKTGGSSATREQAQIHISSLMAPSHVSLHPACPSASHLAQNGMGPLWESRGRGRRYLRQPPGRWLVPRRAPRGRTSLRVRPSWASFPSGAFPSGPEEIRNSVSHVSPHAGQGQQYRGAAWVGRFPGLSPTRAIGAKHFLCRHGPATCAKHGQQPHRGAWGCSASAFGPSPPHSHPLLYATETFSPSP